MNTRELSNGLEALLEDLNYRFNRAIRVLDIIFVVDVKSLKSGSKRVLFQVLTGEQYP